MADAAHASVVQRCCARLAQAAARRPCGPKQRARTLAELSRDLDGALRMPGYQMAIAPPIRTRIDMLTTGVRTPVGIKVFGEDLNEIERVSIALEGMLRQVPGTRSTFAERQTGREYVDIVPNREAIARYGLTVRDVQDVVEAAVGGMQVSTAIAGRARFSINLRYAADCRSDPQALRRILVPVQSSGSVMDFGGAGSGRGCQRPEWRHGRLDGAASRRRDGLDGRRRIAARMSASGGDRSGHKAHCRWVVRRRRLIFWSSGVNRARPFRSGSSPTSAWSRARR